MWPYVSWNFWIVELLVHSLVMGDDIALGSSKFLSLVFFVGSRTFNSYTPTLSHLDSVRLCGNCGIFCLFLYIRRLEIWLFLGCLWQNLPSVDDVLERLREINIPIVALSLKVCLLLKSKQKQSHRPPSKDLKLLILAFLSELGRLWLLQWTPGFFSLASTIIPCELPSYVDMTLDSSPSSSSWESYYDSCTPTVFSSRCGLWNLGVEYCIDDVPIVVGCFWN
jgi:hypothetical protein